MKHKKLFVALAIAFAVLTLVCGTGIVLINLTSMPTLMISITPVVPTLTPIVIPTIVPQPKYEAELKYINAQRIWSSDCSDAMRQMSEVFSNYNTSDFWTQTALEAVYDGQYYCSTLGGYYPVPDIFAYVQSEIDNARADYGTAFDYARNGIMSLDVASLNSSTLYLTRGTTHMSTATAELLRLAAEIK